MGAKNCILFVGSALFSLLFPGISLSQQNNQGDGGDISYFSVEEYNSKIIPSEYKSFINGDDDNFKKLRSFLNRTKSVKVLLTNEISALKQTSTFVLGNTIYYENVDSVFLKRFNSAIREMKDFLDKNKGDSIALDKIPNINFSGRYGYRNYLYDKNYDWDNPSPVNRKILKITKEDIVEDTSAVVQIYEDLKYTVTKLYYLTKNLKIIESDILLCQDQIDRSLSIERDQQNFKTWTSVIFAGLIAILLVSFFVIIFIRSGNGVINVLLSSNGLQFITIFVLIIAVVLFGILSILQSSELAAILSGISGYILGKNGITGNSTNTPPPLPPPLPPPPA